MYSTNSSPTGTGAARSPSVQTLAEKAFRAWLNEIESLPRDARVERIVKKLVHELPIVFELIELLLDNMDAHPRQTLASVIRCLGGWLTRVGATSRAELAAPSESARRRGLKLEARKGVIAVEPRTPGGAVGDATIRADGYTCMPLALAPAEEDLLAELLENRGADDSGLAVWRDKEEVMRAMLRRAKARAAAAGEADTTVHGPRTARGRPATARSNTRRQRPRGQAQNPSGWFNERVRRLRQGILHARGNPWWVQCAGGRIRFAIRRPAPVDAGAASSRATQNKDR
jgi:hypothetical protein